MSKTLATKLAAVTEAVGHIPKSGRNLAQGYDYVTDADVLDTIRTALAKQGVATIVDVTEVNTSPFTTGKGSPMFLVTIKGAVTFIDGETGDREVAEMAGAGSDSTDKGIYKAITGAVKYALLKTFLVPTGDDPERDTNDDGGGARQPRSGDSVGKTRAGADDARKARESSASQPADSVKVGLTDNQRKMLKARMTSKGLKGPQQAAFAFGLVGKAHSNQMDNADLDKLLAALEDDALVAQAIAEVSEAA